MIEAKDIRARIALELRENDAWKSVMQYLRESRPISPLWDPKGNNVEELKAASAKQQHHDFLMAVLDL